MKENNWRSQDPSGLSSAASPFDTPHKSFIHEFLYLYLYPYIFLSFRPLFCSVAYASKNDAIVARRKINNVEGKECRERYYTTTDYALSVAVEVGHHYNILLQGTNVQSNLLICIHNKGIYESYRTNKYPYYFVRFMFSPPFIMYTDQHFYSLLVLRISDLHLISFYY